LALKGVDSKDLAARVRAPDWLFFWCGMAVPVQPFHLPGKHKPVVCKLIEHLPEAGFVYLYRTALRFDCATAVLVSSQVHLSANRECD